MMDLMRLAVCVVLLSAVAAGQAATIDWKTIDWKAQEAEVLRHYPGAVTLPTMLTGATDMAFLRAKGVQSYGIGPAASDRDRTNYGAHSDVERLLESSLYSFTRFTWEAVMEVSASK
jgi:hypothetical protein